jgi:hypothetical protein
MEATDLDAAGGQVGQRSLRLCPICLLRHPVHMKGSC